MALKNMSDHCLTVSANLKCMQPTHTAVLGCAGWPCSPLEVREVCLQIPLGAQVEGL
jgi:hypothetical protein